MTRPRRGSSHRWQRWLWTSRRLDARLARVALLPASALWQSAMWLRSAAHGRDARSVIRLPLPSVAIGNLSVGGSGKTPIAAWVADYYQARGHRPAVLLRGVGGDETLVHQELVPGAVVIANADRAAGAMQALEAHADVVVLDDAYQRLDIARDLNVCLVSAESARAVRWSLPAGPWREGRGALQRADVVMVTRKRADPAAAARLVDELRRWAPSALMVVARLDLNGLRGLVSNRPCPVATLQGKRVVAASAIADPETFVAQVKRSGAQVQVATWKDHHLFRDEDVAWLAHAARRADAVVVTAKDAVKLRHRWPASVPEPLVAALTVTLETGAEEFHAALDRVIARS